MTEVDFNRKHSPHLVGILFVSLIIFNFSIIPLFCHQGFYSENKVFNLKMLILYYHILISVLLVMTDYLG